MKREFKILEMKAPTVEENCIKGDAGGIGNLDRGNDVIFPGFFKKVLNRRKSMKPRYFITSKAIEEWKTAS